VNILSPQRPASSLEGPRTHVPLWLLALFTLSGTLGMHMFVPGLPQAAAELGASPASLKLTLSVYILGLGLGQLVYGPMSDRFGRRPTAIAGLLLFTVSGFAAIFAQSVGALITLRLFQALGGSSGLVVARAVVRDTATTQGATRRLALMNLMVMVGPGIAPLVGGALTSFVGWRSIFIALCMLGVGNLVFAWRLLPETSRNKDSDTSIATWARNYRSLLASPAFIGYAIGGGCATTAHYAFIASAPFIFVDQLNRPASETGLYLAFVVSGVWLGSFLASRLIGRFSLNRFLVTTNAVSVAAALAFLLLASSGHLSAALVVSLMLVFNIGVGGAAPAALVLAISVNRQVVGSASGLYGFAQMGIGATLTALAGLGHDPALSTSIVLASAGVVAQSSIWIATHHRHGGPASV
jgi:DHA1 family bicyclomycin/chloramphenicol resistance-like MFS transporter